jgi:hypothetical protein
MLNLKSILLSVALASTAGTATALAAPPSRTVIVNPRVGPERVYGRWESLGEVRVDGRRPGMSTLYVNRSLGPVTQLRLQVQRGDLGMKTVRITFENGRTFVTAMHGPSTVIDLPGRARNIRAIDIDAPPSWRRSRAVVAVLADTVSSPYAYHR